MTSPSSGPPSARRADTPQGVLGDVWTALDALPTATMPASMTATTIEMAAVTSRGRSAAAERSPGWWLLAAVVVAGCFAIGLVIGRATLGPLDLRPRLPPREAIREIIEEEVAKQRRQEWERTRDQRRPVWPPEKMPALPRGRPPVPPAGRGVPPEAR
jgi:hypothetical protein